TPEPAPDQLARVLASGKLRVNIELNYAPQSFQNPDGTYDGFNVDVGAEIAERMGLEVEFSAIPFDAVVAGSWADRFDISVGSVTVTEQRKEVLDFAQPYYYSVAELAATTASGITTLDGFAGQAICMGAGTSYQQWVEGTLALVDAPEPAPVPEGATTFIVETDQNCVESVTMGRADFAGWLTDTTLVRKAIAEGAPVVAVAPVFAESLAVALDASVADNDTFLAAVDAIIADMHEDGTLTELSKKWYEGLDLTVAGQ
ncbi:MAG: transporter substrate-binding domain-containing protein, partial [Chloroflexota bacterium]